MGEYIEYFFTEEELSIRYKGKGIKLIKEKGYKLNGKKEGIWIEGYFNNYEYYYKEINYIDNIHIGKCTEYYKNDKLYKEYYYLNDLLEGKYIQYYNYGKIKSICNYINDKLVGEYIEYNV
jgi:antitoxin component YwqK of YwqJK toxin-antitoxin module